MVNGIPGGKSLLTGAVSVLLILLLACGTAATATPCRQGQESWRALGTLLNLGAAGNCHAAASTHGRWLPFQPVAANSDDVVTLPHVHPVVIPYPSQFLEPATSVVHPHQFAMAVASRRQSATGSRVSTHHPGAPLKVRLRISTSSSTR